MKSGLVPLLRCPSCRGGLQLDARDVRQGGGHDAEVIAGSLACEACGKSYAVDAGIPRLLAASAHETERRWTASRFGYLWAQSSPELASEPRPYHFEKIQAAVVLPPLRGRVLDAGCGEGIDLANVARHAGVEAIGVELSEGGAATSYARTRHLPNAHVIQADLRAIPLADETFDLVYSYGVVHHLTPPEAAVRELARVARDGATVAIYVYEDFSRRALAMRVGLRSVNTVRGITTRVSPRLLFALCRVASPVVYATFTVPHLLLRNVPGLRAVAGALPFRHAAGPFSLAGDLYDRFSAPIELRFNREGTAALLGNAGLVDIRTGYERGWVAAGLKPPASEAR
jgi:SAM-dependent methyltransferase